MKIIASCCSVGSVSVTLLSTSIAMALAGGSEVMAQERAATQALDEIVVTATQRERSLREVPIAVSAYSGQVLEDSGIRDIRDLIGLSPSLDFQTPGGDSDSSIRVRGIGTNATNPGLESAVGVVIDGVPRSRTGVALSELGNVERIEVLRGPQGTLFGRSTSAGLINIITKSPNMQEFEASVSGTLGNFDYYRLGGYVTGPLVEGSSAGLLEVTYQRRDGFLYEVNTNRDINIMDRLFVRGKLSFEPSDVLSIDFSADYTNRDEDCCAAPLFIAGPSFDRVNELAAEQGNIGHASANPFDRLMATTAGRINQEDVEDYGISMQVTWANALGELTSITAYRDWKANRGQDFTHAGVDLGVIPEDGIIQKFQVLSQELRLQGEQGRLDWLVGLWYAREDASDERRFRMGSQFGDWFGGAAAFNPATLAAFTPLDGSVGFADQKGDDYSIFTHNVLALTDRLNLTVGARLTNIRKKIVVTGINENPACETAVAVGDGLGIALFCLAFWDSRMDPAGDSTSQSETAWSGTISLDYALWDNANTYVSYSRGFKAGGFNFDRAGFSTPANPDANDLAFPKETVDAYELGFKVDLFDRKLRASTALFYQEFVGFQTIQFTGVSFFVDSLPSVRTSGFEVELDWRPIPGLAAYGAFTYNDAVYSNNPANAAFAGQQMEMAPKRSFVGSLSYDTPLGNTGYEGRFHIDARHVSEHLTGGFDPNRAQGAYALANARLGIAPQGGAWRVEVWARNLFDRDHVRRILPATFQGGSYSAFLGDPRTYGVTLRMDF